MVYSGIVTNTGSALNLATALGFGAGNPRRTDPIGWISFAADTANAAAAYIGTNTDVATTYALRLEIPTSNIPDAPTIIEDAKGMGLMLESLFVVGANNEKIRVLWLTA